VYTYAHTSTHKHTHTYTHTHQVKEDVASVETKYTKLLEEKIADVDQFTKDRLHKVCQKSPN
jgi:hypothetical protein